jgi:hypothetical protein
LAREDCWCDGLRRGSSAAPFKLVASFMASADTQTVLQQFSEPLKSRRPHLRTVKVRTK